MGLKTWEVKLVNCDDWDSFVEGVYGRPYRLLRQYGGRDRGIQHLTVPDYTWDDAGVMPSAASSREEEPYGIQFRQWLERDPQKGVKGVLNDIGLREWWEAIFFPNVQAVGNDLYEKGLLAEGDYIIESK